MASASDNFTRANGALGANWTDWSWSGAHPCAILSDQATGFLNEPSGGTWTGSSFGNDQYSQVTVAVLPGSGWVGVTVRQESTGTGGYLGLWLAGGEFYLFTENGSASPPELTSAAGTMSAGDTLKIEAVGDVITLSCNGTQVLSVTDSTSTSGSPGIAFYGNTAAVSEWASADISSVTVTTTEVANVVDGMEVRRWLAASGGTTPYTWEVSSGSLPAGMTLSSAGKLGGTPTGTGTSTFTVQATDVNSNSGTSALTITSVSAPLSPSSPQTDGNGVITWQVASSINSGDAESIRVLTPTSPGAGYDPAFLITLPVSGGTDDTTFGNGLDTIRGLGLHNTYNLTVIEPSTGGNWLADNPSNSALLQETYIRQVVAWAQATYGTGNAYLIGFSRSGIAGQGLLLHWPDVFQAVASWDFPAAMTGYDGTDPYETVGGSSASSYGTADNFVSNYELSPANLATWIAGTNLTTDSRIWIGSGVAFTQDVPAYDALLTSLGIRHTYASVSASEHNWAPSPGWVAPALAAIMPSPADVSLTLSVGVEINVYAGLSLEATIEMNVGAPYQGDIRNLATDRWYSMYPS